MRAFIISCLMSLSLAAPQGYNYQQQAGRIQLPAIPQIASIDGQQLLQQALQATSVQQVFSGNSANSNYNAPSAQSHNNNNYQQPQQSNNFAFNSFPQLQQQQPQQHQQHQQQQRQQQYPQQSYSPAAGPALVSKDIYVHVPPAEEEERYPQPQLPVAPPRKHYRIVFIKAPTPSINKATLRVKQAPAEEKTIIYVLTKRPDPLDLQAAFEEAAPKPPSKPEVFFIKYKTQEEAAHAQRTIQAQYDQLGGTTQVSDEGVAPVTSVIGSLDNLQRGGANNGATIGAGSVVPNQYLPANLRA